MIVLHALWSTGDGPMLWAENSDAKVTSSSQAVRQARPHPFASTAEQLGTVLSYSPDRATPMVVHLPSLKMSPLDSPELIRVNPRSSARGAPSLLPWTVAAVVPTQSELGTLLNARLIPTSVAADVRPAASLHGLARIVEFAEDLVARGRLIPDVEWRSDTAHARWRAVLTGADAAIAHDLAASMPPSFRAGSPHETTAALVSTALDYFVDARARELISDSFLAPRRGRSPRETPIAELWLEALAGSDSEILADEQKITEFEAELVEFRAVGREDPGPAGLVFRLVEPRPSAEAEEDLGWRVEFLLRSRSDHSLLVEASAVWSDDGVLGRWLATPREVLLTELARAQRIVPALEAGLRSATPTGVTLDTQGAHRFLVESTLQLAEAGFEVQLPGSWSRRRTVGLQLTATPSDASDADSGLGKEQLADFRWDLAVGEHSLTAEEIEALTTAKAPLIQLRGEWVAFDQESLERGLRYITEHGSGTKKIADILSLALSHPADLDLPLEITGVTAEGWLGELLNGTAADSISEVEAPPGFLATLRPYQGRGLGWLDFLGRLGLGAVLADDMGLGKTVQLLALEATARHRESQAPTLLLCPMSLVGNWEAEARKFAPDLRVNVWYGPDRPHGEALTAAFAEADLVITTYSTALRDIDELSEVAWQRVVLDEAQAVKNRLSRIAKAVRKLDAEQRIALTGTPVENRLAELWSIMDFVNPGMLGDPERFRERFSRPIEVSGDPEAAQTLRRITRPYILRRLKTDPSIIDDLPAKIEIKQHYRLTVEQASLYQSIVDEMMGKIELAEGIERHGQVLAAMTKLKQVCNHPAQLLHDGSPIGARSGKVQRFEEIMEEVLAEGDRVLCFTQFTEFAEMLVPHVGARFDTDVAYLSGSTSRARRTEMVERFQNGEGPPVLVLSLKAGGTGLNLTAANHVMHLDRWWNPAVENQATDRAYRIGQKRTVQVRKFMGIGTLEERIDAMLDDKQALADLVVGDGESWLTELSTSQLRDLFTLSKDAIGE